MSDDFGLNLNDFDNSQSFTAKLAEGYNPGGSNSLTTSASKEKYVNQSLTSRDVVDMMAGGALTRNPATLMDLNNRFVQSSLHGILAAGAKSEAFTIPNPDYQGNAGEVQTLTGSAAYIKAVSQSIVGTGLSPSRISNPLLQKLIGDAINNASVSYVGESNGTIYKHNQVSYQLKQEGAPSLGARPIAIADELSPEESAIYLERGKELNKRIPDTALVVGFQFDIPNSFSSYKFSQTNSYFPDSSQTSEITGDLISADSKRAYVCAALIECLLMLTDPTKGVSIVGRFGLARAILSESDETSRNADPSTGIDANNTNAISDHAFGRAFDIDAIGSFRNFDKSKEHYAASLNYVLSRLNSMPMQLIPDLIIISPDVAKDLGVMEGFDSESTALKTMYPNLKYVDFESASAHKDNIHISFSHSRAGQYIGSPGFESKEKVQSSDGSSVPVNTEEDINAAKEKSRQNCKSSNVTISLTELFIMLSKEGPLSEEVAAIMCAVAGRESALNPGGFNGKCGENANEYTGDYSVGMFQFNLISLINKSKNTSGTVSVYYDGTAVNPQKVSAAELAYVPGKTAGWDPNAIAKKMIELQNNGKADTDDRLWYPINQVWMLMDKWGWDGFKNTSKITQSNGFYHWGDYPNRSDVGFIFETRFQDAVDVYLTSGKTIDELTNWVRKNLPKFNPKTADYIELWMNGEVFYDKPKNGTLKDESRSKPITYGKASAESSPGAENDNKEPTFTNFQILQAANWLKSNRIPAWLSKYGTDKENFQCDRFARVLAASVGLLGGQADTKLTSKIWDEENFGEQIKTTVPTNQEQYRNFESAGAHWENVKGGTKDTDWFAADSEKGKNPPVGYLVFWSGGNDGYGHVGVSIGGGQYVDQHSSNERPSPRPITFNGFPGDNYTYVGSSSVWAV